MLCCIACGLAVLSPELHWHNSVLSNALHQTSSFHCVSKAVVMKKFILKYFLYKYLYIVIGNSYGSGKTSLLIWYLIRHVLYNISHVLYPHEGLAVTSHPVTELKPVQICRWRTVHYLFFLSLVGICLKCSSCFCQHC